MRKRFRVLLLAAIVAAFIVPVGFALSLDSSPRAHTGAAATASVVPVVLIGGHSSLGALFEPLPDAAKLLLVGTTFFGLAAALRKTN